MSLGNNTTINAALRRVEKLSRLNEHQLDELAREVDMRHALPGGRLLELGSEDTRLLFLLKGELELVASDGAVRIVRHTDSAALGPVSRLRPSRYRVTARTRVDYLLVEQTLLDEYSSLAAAGTVVVEESYLVSEPNELIDDSATHPLMFDVFNDLNHGRIVVPSDPDVAVRVGRSLTTGGNDIARLAKTLAICPALTLKAIRAAKAVNSNRIAIRSIKQAIRLLGTEQTLELTVKCILCESLRTHSSVVLEWMHSWWERTVRVAAISQELARMSERFNPEYAALVGLLHSIAEPVLLGYADRHPDLCESTALDNVVHDNRAELGRILLTLWGMPKEIADAAAKCNHWGHEGSGEADYTDIILVAQWHATIGGSHTRRLPAMENIPAFRRLGLHSASPELGIKIMEAANQAIEEADAMLIG